jgi:hypothetical protein
MSASLAATSSSVAPCTFTDESWPLSFFTSPSRDSTLTRVPPRNAIECPFVGVMAGNKEWAECSLSPIPPPDSGGQTSSRLRVRLLSPSPPLLPVRTIRLPLFLCRSQSSTFLACSLSLDVVLRTSTHLVGQARRAASTSSIGVDLPLSSAYPFHSIARLVAVYSRRVRIRVQRGMLYSRPGEEGKEGYWGRARHYQK